MGPLQTKDISYSSKYPNKKKRKLKSYQHLFWTQCYKSKNQLLEKREKSKKNTQAHADLKKNMALNNQRIIGEIKEEI